MFMGIIELFTNSLMEAEKSLYHGRSFVKNIVQYIVIFLMSHTLFCGISEEKVWINCEKIVEKHGCHIYVKYKIRGFSISF